MIEVDIKLNPHGSGEGIRSIGGINLANIGSSGEANSYNYVYWINEPASAYSDGVSLHGVIYNHNNYNPAVDLLKKIMEDYGASSNKISEKYFNYWNDSKNGGEK